MGDTGNCVSAAQAPDLESRREQNTERWDIAADSLDLDKEEAEDLMKWGNHTGVEVIVLAGDGTSMNTTADFQKGTTRWQELRHVLNGLIELLLVVDSDSSFELRFLNKGAATKISTREDLDSAFPAAPRGPCPLVARLQEYLDPQGPLGHERLVIVLTDGTPSDGTFGELARVVRSKPHEDVFVSFIMCTEDNAIVTNYEHHLDRIPGVDVNDDYLSEQKQAVGHGKTLTQNQYLVKCILGPKFEKYDQKDEVDAGCGSKCTIT